MTQEESNGQSPPISKLPLDDAVEKVHSNDPTVDMELVRTALNHVEEDGTVDWDTVPSKVEELADELSEAQSRTDRTVEVFERVIEVPEPVSDLSIVSSRIEVFESEVEDLESRVEDLWDDLQDLEERSSDRSDLFQIARRIEEIQDEANGIQSTADEIVSDLEAFEDWLEQPETRIQSILDDVDAIEQSIQAQIDTVDQLENLQDRVSDSDSGKIDFELLVHVGWFDANIQRRVLELVLEDARCELADLQRWYENEGRDFDRHDEIHSRLGELEADLDSLTNDLDELSQPSWIDQYDDRLSAVETALDQFEPPVEWSHVRSAVREYRPIVQADH